MAEIQKFIQTYKDFNTEVFALSTDSPEQSENLMEKMNFSLTLLCDEDKKVIDLFNLRNPFEHDGIAYPGTFIINPDSTICYRSLDGLAKRVNLSDEVAFLEQLHKDRSHTMQEKPQKKWVLPSPKDNWQMAKNMLYKGNFADWKHFLLLPVEYLSMLASKIRKSF